MLLVFRDAKVGQLYGQMDLNQNEKNAWKKTIKMISGKVPQPRWGDYHHQRKIGLFIIVSYPIEQRRNSVECSLNPTKTKI